VRMNKSLSAHVRMNKSLSAHVRMNKSLSAHVRMNKSLSAHVLGIRVCANRADYVFRLTCVLNTSARECPHRTRARKQTAFTCMHATCIHTYIHACIHAYMHAYICARHDFSGCNEAQRPRHGAVTDEVREARGKERSRGRKTGAERLDQHPQSVRHRRSSKEA
jgi:hypothetical protein